MVEAAFNSRPYEINLPLCIPRGGFLTSSAVSHLRALPIEFLGNSDAHHRFGGKGIRVCRRCFLMQKGLFYILSTNVIPAFHCASLHVAHRFAARHYSLSLGALTIVK